MLDAGRGSFTLSEVKRIVLDLLAAVEHLHRKWVIHRCASDRPYTAVRGSALTVPRRDIKMPNLLYDDGALKVADFGLARHFSEPLGRMTPRVVTLHYRAPELLLKAPQYDTAVDMWSVGCIIGELLLGHVMLRGRTESEQLNLIFQLVGTPTEARWPGWAELPGARDLALAVHTTPRGSKLDKVLPMLPPEGLSLMEGLLCLDPSQRLSVRGARSLPLSLVLRLPHPLLGRRPRKRASTRFFTLRRSRSSPSGCLRSPRATARGRVRHRSEARQGLLVRDELHMQWAGKPNTRGGV